MADTTDPPTAARPEGAGARSGFRTADTAGLTQCGTIRGSQPPAALLLLRWNLGKRTQANATGIPRHLVRGECWVPGLSLVPGLTGRDNVQDDRGRHSAVPLVESARQHCRRNERHLSQQRRASWGSVAEPPVLNPPTQQVREIGCGRPLGRGLRMRPLRRRLEIVNRKSYVKNSVFLLIFRENTLRHYF